MSLRRARSAEEYAEWVKQAMFEVGDLKDCLLYEIEDLQRFPGYIEPLEEGVKQVYDAMVAGTYSFGRDDLAFMEVLRRHEDQIPFHTLLKQINETHRKGLEVRDKD
ncbi:MAG: general secretion pathway protein GspF [Gammaproteobacteria bacterium]|nr:general secretion pathway protein GspF [Gammaproteobacteria bacterium]